MYAKSFLALDGNGRLTGARTAQTAPYAYYTCTFAAVYSDTTRSTTRNVPGLNTLTTG
ncbi:hypothetical protein RW86_02982 [Escherichia coli]|nr:hypothetical protein RW85_01766 [Escherichia coli]OYA60509.1 hypothetical protein RW86_02982 [Escherichia coli]